MVTIYAVYLQTSNTHFNSFPVTIATEKRAKYNSNNNLEANEDANETT